MLNLEKERKDFDLWVESNTSIFENKIVDEVVRFQRENLLFEAWVASAERREKELNDLITPSEAARLFGTSRTAIHNLISRKRLKRQHIAGSSFVSKKDVLEFEKLKTGRKSSSL